LGDPEKAEAQKIRVHKLLKYADPELPPALQLDW
jgi:hypothetical protein